MKIAKKLISGVLAGTIAFTGLGLVDLPIGQETQKAEAASVNAFGVSVNPIQDNFYISNYDWILVAIQNYNSYDVDLRSQIQKKNADGTWTNVTSIRYTQMAAYGDPNNYDYGLSCEAVLNDPSDPTNLTSTGTYRVKYNVYDNYGTYYGTFASSQFYVHN